MMILEAPAPRASRPWRACCSSPAVTLFATWLLLLHHHVEWNVWKIGDAIGMIQSALVYDDNLLMSSKLPPTLLQEILPGAGLLWQDHYSGMMIWKKKFSRLLLRIPRLKASFFQVSESYSSHESNSQNHVSNVYRGWWILSTLLGDRTMKKLCIILHFLAAYARLYPGSIVAWIPSPRLHFRSDGFFV